MTIPRLLGFGLLGLLLLSGCRTGPIEPTLAPPATNTLTSESTGPAITVSPPPLPTLPPTWPTKPSQTALQRGPSDLSRLDVGDTTRRVKLANKLLMQPLVEPTRQAAGDPANMTYNYSNIEAGKLLLTVVGQ